MADVRGHEPAPAGLALSAICFCKAARRWSSRGDPVGDAADARLGDAWRLHRFQGGSVQAVSNGCCWNAVGTLGLELWMIVEAILMFPALGGPGGPAPTRRLEPDPGSTPELPVFVQKAVHETRYG